MASLPGAYPWTPTPSNPCLLKPNTPLPPEVLSFSPYTPYNPLPVSPSTAVLLEFPKRNGAATFPPATIFPVADTLPDLMAPVTLSEPAMLMAVPLWLMIESFTVALPPLVANLGRNPALHVVPLQSAPDFVGLVLCEYWSGANQQQGRT
jgi:hypothetical protein